MGIICDDGFNSKHKILDVGTANKLSKSICKIIDNNNIQKKYGTGFFMICKSLKLLISNYHVISSDLINKNIWNWNLEWKKD